MKAIGTRRTDEFNGMRSGRKKRKGKRHSKKRVKATSIVAPEKRAEHGQKDFAGFGEKEACELLNSARMTHPWKKDFDKNQEPHEDWDLINSEGVRIEVKSTSRLETFRITSVTLSTPGQAKQIILKVLLGERGEIRDYKFVRKLGTRWVNITDEVCGSVSFSKTRPGRQ